MNYKQMTDAMLMQKCTTGSKAIAELCARYSKALLELNHLRQERIQNLNLMIKLCHRIETILEFCIENKVDGIERFFPDYIGDLKNKEYQKELRKLRRANNRVLSDDEDN